MVVYSNVEVKYGRRDGITRFEKCGDWRYLVGEEDNTVLEVLREAQEQQN